MMPDVELDSWGPVSRPEEAEDKHDYGPDEGRPRNVSSAAEALFKQRVPPNPADEEGIKPFSDHVVVKANELFLEAKAARKYTIPFLKLEISKDTTRWIMVGMAIVSIAISILGLGIPAAIVGGSALLFFGAVASASYAIHKQEDEKKLQSEYFGEVWDKEFKAMKDKYGDIPEMQAFWQNPKHPKAEDSLMEALTEIRKSSNPNKHKFARELEERISVVREEEYKRVYNEKDIRPEGMESINSQVAKNPELLEFMKMCEELEKDTLSPGSSKYKKYVDDLFDRYTPTSSTTNPLNYLLYNPNRRFDNTKNKDSVIHDVRLYRQFKAHKEVRDSLRVPNLSSRRRAQLRAKEQKLRNEEQTLLRSYGMISNVP